MTLFKSLPVVHDVYREDALPPAARSYPRETITLGWEERLKGRGRRRSDEGREFGTALARGVTLQQGDCLVLDAPGVVIVVVERPEPVFVITPRTCQEWSLFAYHIGNSHQPLMITEEALICADLAGTAQLLEHHAIPFIRESRPFSPAGMSADHHHSNA